MKEPEWVLRETVLILHEQSLANFGGSAGMRRHDTLDLLLNRPRLFFCLGNPTVFDLAAVYAFGLANNPTFIDGNKRIAFITAVLFLESNGWMFEAGEADATIQTLALAAGELNGEGYAAWLKKNSRKV